VAINTLQINIYLELIILVQLIKITCGIFWGLYILGHKCLHSYKIINNNEVVSPLQLLKRICLGNLKIFLSLIKNNKLILNWNY